MRCHRVMRRAASTVIAATCLVGACRDVGEPFRPIDERGTPGVVRRVTFGPADDRAPAWSVDGDTIYYTTSSWEENPLAPATIVAIPADGSGPARALMPRAQVGTQARAWLTAVAPAPDGERVAFVQVGQLLPEQPCGVTLCPSDPTRPMVRLTEGAVHIRSRDAIGALSEDSILPLAFAGHSVIVDDSVPGDLLTISEYHPFQLEFEEHGRSFFRPSWGPDGERIAVSDGLHIYVWDTRTAVVTRLPASTDGFMPAWSPDGEWVAFAQYPRIASQVVTCEYVFNFVHACSERRVIHYYGEPRIVLARADGTDFIETGILGTDPAWSPDGSFLYASVPLQGYRVIGRIGVEAFEDVLTLSEPELIEGTELGIEPSVSPDGRRLAFAREGGAAHDIWVAELPR